MEHRFLSGELEGHAFGNLLLAALEESKGDLLAALAVASELLEVQGTVLPATPAVVDLVAETADGGRSRDRWLYRQLGCREGAPAARPAGAARGARRNR